MISHLPLFSVYAVTVTMNSPSGCNTGKCRSWIFRTKQIVKDYLLTSELNKKTINSTITEVRPAANGSLLVATDYAGIFIIDRAGNISNYKHDPINNKFNWRQYNLACIKWHKMEMWL